MKCSSCLFNEVDGDMVQCKYLYCVFIRHEYEYRKGKPYCPFCDCDLSETLPKVCPKCGAELKRR